MKVYPAALFVTFAFAACARPTPTSVTTVPPLPSARSAVAGQFLYVASASGGISVYPLGSTVPVRTLPADLPTAIAFDRSGNLYVANHNGGPNGRGYISVFAPGSAKPARTISQGVNVPYSVAFDSKGNLYVANYIRAPDAPKLNNGAVTVYRPNTGTPYRTITHTAHPHQIVVDSKDNLYVAGLSLELYAPGATKPERNFGIIPRQRPTAIGVDSKDRLYAGFFDGCPYYCEGQIEVFPPGKKKVYLTDFIGAHDEGYIVAGFAFDSLGDIIFSLNTGPVHIGGGQPVSNGEVGVFPTLHHHDGRHRFWILSGASNGPNAGIVDGNDNVIVGNNGSVNAFLAHEQSLLYSITQGISGQVTALAIAAQ